jgi:hypothetical protein
VGYLKRQKKVSFKKVVLGKSVVSKRDAKQAPSLTRKLKHDKVITNKILIWTKRIKLKILRIS